MRTTKTLALVLSSLTLSAQFAYASADFEYPELQVTPRASDRLNAEVAHESNNRWTEYLPTQLSAASTLVAGFMLSGDAVKDTTKSYNVAGIAVGGGWLATTLLLEALSRPYATGSQETEALPRKTQREQLTRERYAEEIIRSQARLACRIKWLSTVTTLGTNVLIASNATSGSAAQIAAGVGAALSLAPVIFHSYRQDVADEQEDYKKRIYGPVASATIFSDPVTGLAAPGMLLSLSF
jgi:hypothetical protein